MAQFCDDSLEQWLSDLTWVSDDGKVQSLLVDIFSHRARFSPVQARLWCRVIQLYWRQKLTKRQIAENFGISKENVRRIVKALRREAARFFEAVQSLSNTKPIAEPARKSVPFAADSTNETQEHWDTVLASYGLHDPDRRARGWTRKNPVYKFEWHSRTSVHAFGWGEFYETQTKPKPTFHALQKTGGSGSWGKAEQVGTTTLVIDGQRHDVRVFEPGRACTFGWNANLRRRQSGPALDSECDFFSRIDRAIDGSQEALQYLQEYERLEAEKYSDPRGFKIVPAIDTEIASDKTTTAPYLIEQSQCRESYSLDGSVKSSANAKQNRATCGNFF